VSKNVVLKAHFPNIRQRNVDDVLCLVLAEWASSYSLMRPPPPPPPPPKGPPLKNLCAAGFALIKKTTKCSARKQGDESQTGVAFLPTIMRPL